MRPTASDRTRWSRFIGVRAAYGRIEALHGIDLAVFPGTVVALLGPNGAGKTTALQVASGQLVPTSGCFHVLGLHVNGVPSDVLARSGVCTIPEGRGVFPNLTVLENLRMMSFAGHAPAPDRGAGLRPLPPAGRASSPARRHHVGGEQQMLAMARALSVEPAVLLLDEISMGLAPLIVDELYALVATVAADGVAILLTEQFARAALEVADHVVLMSQGRIVASGTPGSLPEDLAAAYLGGATEPASGSTSGRGA